jgi:sugar/nucleoside kinase (ribokinase family)
MISNAEQSAPHSGILITAVGDCGVDRYLDLGRDRPGGITLNFAANARRLFPARDTVGVVTALGTDRKARPAPEAAPRRHARRGGKPRPRWPAAPRVPAVAVPHVVDTTGAGDTFAAGFLREYCASRDAARSLARGAEEAAAAVQRVGAFPWEY